MLEIDVPLLNDVYKTSKDPRRIVVVSAPSNRARRSKGQRRDWLPDGRNELRTPDRRYRPCDRSPVVMYRAGSLRLALRAGFKLSKDGADAAAAWSTE